ncbi:MAG: VCBS repeat-containing protein [Pyrinomonadaceae bacterium]|nr:VCBS repeat-containing protein [Pyrinomonadaceae bacterium]
MKNFLTVFGKIGFATFCLLALTLGVFAQIGLRKALDVDADNKADFTVLRPSNNTYYSLKSTGGFSSTQFGVAADDVSNPGDFDGDGKGDVAVFRDPTGSWFWINSSNNTLGAVQFGTSGDEPVGRDYDGDGKTDPAVVRRTGGNMFWYIFQSSNGATRSEQFGLSTDITVTGDYDGDGKYDIGVQRPGTPNANFFINRSTAGFLAIPWGFSNDLVAPGDYDGDGKTDICVVREGETFAPNQLLWYVLRSSNNQFQGIGFGEVANDLIVQADYDGDGKTNYAVWRNSNGTYYYLNDLNGALVGIPWGIPDDYPVASYDTH